MMTKRLFETSFKYIIMVCQTSESSLVDKYSQRDYIDFAKVR